MTGEEGREGKGREGRKGMEGDGRERKGKGSGVQGPQAGRCARGPALTKTGLIATKTKENKR